MSRIAAILISLLGIFLIGFFLLWPQYQTLRELNFKIQEKKTELQYKEEYFSNLKKISEELKNYEPALSKIDSAFPSDPSLPSLFNFFEKAGSQNGLILKYIGPFYISSRPDMPKVKEIHINITVTGSYPAFKNFLSALEKTARLFELENISFSSPEKTEEPFAFELKIKAYSY